MNKWKPWSGHRMTMMDRSKLPQTPPSGRKTLNPNNIPVDVSYKWNNANRLIWQGKEHTAWASRNLEQEYCSFGDKIVAGLDAPTAFNLLVKDHSSGQNNINFKGSIFPYDKIQPSGRRYFK